MKQSKFSGYSSSAYEEHHRLKISDDALEAAARLSARYVADRFLPDKAIDLVDEASSRVRMYKSTAATSAKEVMRQIRTVRQNYSLAVEDSRADDAQDLQQQEAELDEQLERMRTTWDRCDSPRFLLKILLKFCLCGLGFRLSSLQEESERLLRMEDELRNHIVGQDEAIEAIAKSVRRARAGLKDPRRPIGSFIFFGPTGVGKTELTKALAQFLFGSEDALIHLDMSEFMERHSQPVGRFSAGICGI